MLYLAAWILWPVLCLGVGAGEAEWKAGIATVKITPEEPLKMAGYASR